MMRNASAAVTIGMFEAFEVEQIAGNDDIGARASQDVIVVGIDQSVVQDSLAAANGPQTVPVGAVCAVRF